MAPANWDVLAERDSAFRAILEFFNAIVADAIAASAETSVIQVDGLNIEEAVRVICGSLPMLARVEGHRNPPLHPWR